jgi:hypothetical protein
MSRGLCWDALKVLEFAEHNGTGQLCGRADNNNSIYSLPFRELKAKRVSDAVSTQLPRDPLLDLQMKRITTCMTASDADIYVLWRGVLVKYLLVRILSAVHFSIHVPVLVQHKENTTGVDMEADSATIFTQHNKQLKTVKKSVA